MQPTDPQTRVREGPPPPGDCGDPLRSHSFLLLFLQDQSTSRHGISRKLSLWLNHKEVERSEYLLTKDAPHKGARRVTVGAREVGRWGASPWELGVGSKGLSRLAVGLRGGTCMESLCGSGIYAAACVIPRARRISRPLFSAGTSLFFKLMVTHF